MRHYFQKWCSSLVTGNVFCSMNEKWQEPRLDIRPRTASLTRKAAASPDLPDLLASRPFLIRSHSREHLATASHFLLSVRETDNHCWLMTTEFLFLPVAFKSLSPWATKRNFTQESYAQNTAWKMYGKQMWKAWKLSSGHLHQEVRSVGPGPHACFLHGILAGFDCQFDCLDSDLRKFIGDS